MLAHHPKHSIILSVTTPCLRLPDPRRFDFDFRELDQAWRLRVVIAPKALDIDAPSLASAQKTLRAIEHALDTRRINNRAANRYCSDEERQVHANWLKVAAELMRKEAKWYETQAESLEAAAPTAFKGRRSA